MYSNLDISVKKALEQRVDTNCELLVTCFAYTTLDNVIELFVTHEAHRLIIIDEQDKVVGIICLSDVLAFLTTVHNNELKELKEDELNKESNLIKEENDGKQLREDDELNKEDKNKEFKEII